MTDIEIPTLVEEGATTPDYQTQEAAGADIRAHITEPMIIEPGKSAMIPTGIRVAIPEGYEIQVRPRSGLAAKRSVTVLNTPGTIDSDYRGELKVILINHGTEGFVVESEMRIAQLVLAPVVRAQFVLHERLVETTRGEGGFGHTGQS